MKLLSKITLLFYLLTLIKFVVLKDMDMILIGKMRLYFGGAESGTANWIPLHTILAYLKGEKGLLISRLNLMGNLLLLSPIGFLLPICFPKIRSGQIWFISFVFCGLIEIIQISLSIGIFDVDDIILNGLGGVLGFMMHKYMVKKYVNAGLILLFCLLILGMVYYLLFSVPFENPV